MNENNQPAGESDKSKIAVPGSMDKHSKLIAAGSAAMVISFFMPWIDLWIGGIAPSKLLKAGFDGLTFGTALFLGTFILAAAVCIQIFSGKANHRLVIAAGLLPFLIGIWALIQAKSATSSLPFDGLGHLIRIASYGLPVYYIGAGVTLVNGLIKSDDVPAGEEAAEVASYNTADTTTVAPSDKVS